MPDHRMQRGQRAQRSQQEYWGDYDQEAERSEQARGEWQRSGRGYDQESGWRGQSDPQYGRQPGMGTGSYYGEQSQQPGTRRDVGDPYSQRRWEGQQQRQDYGRSQWGERQGSTGAYGPRGQQSGMYGPEEEYTFGGGYGEGYGRSGTSSSDYGYSSGSGSWGGRRYEGDPWGVYGSGAGAGYGQLGVEGYRGGGAFGWESGRSSDWERGRSQGYQGRGQDWERGGATNSWEYGSGYRGGPYAGRGPRGYKRSDDRIFEDVCERLTMLGGVDASDIEVEVRNGEVTLRGCVRDRWQKRHAEEALEDIPGVKDITNQLKIEGGTRMDGGESGQGQRKSAADVFSSTGSHGQSQGETHSPEQLTHSSNVG